MSATPIPDATILAAVDRAARHSGRPGASIRVILEHLGLPPRTRRVRPRLREFAGSGVLATVRVHGTQRWSLAPKGRQQLRAAHDGELPESPQHRHWRAARTLAEREIGAFRSATTDTLTDAAALLEECPSSDDWFEIADRLQNEARRLGSATYCLTEWTEPSDDRADNDDLSMPGDELLDEKQRARRRARRAGRRNTTLWPDDT
jgi:hypothetical protein